MKVWRPSCQRPSTPAFFFTLAQTVLKLVAGLLGSVGTGFPNGKTYQPGSVTIEYVSGSWAKAVAESFTVPSESPYTYSLQQASNLITFVNVTDGDDNPVSCTNNAGTLTFTEAQAGQSYTANYTVNACPQAVVQAILLLVKHWYDHREAVSDLNFKQVPLATKALLTAHRMEAFILN